MATRIVKTKPKTTDNNGQQQPTTCQWFLLCNNPATTTREHPILGDVPCCERCKERL